MRKFAEASIDLSWIGTKEPEEHDDIEDGAIKEEKKMLDFVMDLYDDLIQEKKYPGRDR